MIVNPTLNQAEFSKGTSYTLAKDLVFDILYLKNEVDIKIGSIDFPINSIDNGKYGYGGSPLHAAAEKGYIKVLKILLINGADVNLLNSSKQTPLFSAATHSQSNAARFLIESGAKVIIGEDSEYTNIFHKSITQIDGDLAQFFLDEGATINFIDSYGETPLSQAAAYGKIETVKVLIDNHADLELGAPLFCAVVCKRLDVVELLLDKGANINLANIQWLRGSVLHRAIFNKVTDIALLLINRGIDLSILDSDKRTALHEAALYGNVPVAKLLLEKGINVTSLDKDGESALVDAFRMGEKEIYNLIKSYMEK